MCHSCYIILSESHHFEVSFAGCFSILPATELVPGDIVEVAGEFGHSDFPSGKELFGMKELLCQFRIFILIFMVA